jgi:DNA-binding CsgD family transcriptional regulator/tetratricopeptide (TPR) repeat protein
MIEHESVTGAAGHGALGTSSALDALDHIIGRASELEAIQCFVAEVAQGPSRLVIEGEPGIGKTTLWSAGVDTARRSGYRVLLARPAEIEVQLSFAALADLLAPVVDEVLPTLPAPQRRALEVALLLSEPEEAAADHRAVATALFGALSTLSDRDPIVVAVDDAQWLDASSAAALEFAFRRLREERVGALLTMRPGGRSFANLTDPLEKRTSLRLEVGPLQISAVHQLLRTQLRAGFSRPILVRIYEASGGNPFFALELGRALERRGSAMEPADPLPVPAELGALVTDRLSALPAGTREALLAASALSPPTLELLQAALGVDAEALLAPAIEADVARREGEKIVFTHPLLSFAAYSQVSAEQRRELHRRLARFVADPEERARHLAIAVEGPDEEIAQALEEGAQSAYARGATHAAAELCERARGLTPAHKGEELRRRSKKEAEYRILSGDSASARDVLEEVIARQTSGPGRADLLRRLADAYLYGLDWRSSAATYRSALEEGETDDVLRARCEVGLALASELLGNPLRESWEHARAASVLADGVGNRSLLAMGLAIQAYSELLLADGHPWALIERACELETETGPLVVRPTLFRAHMLGLVDDFDGALAGIERGSRKAVENGDEVSQGWLLARMSLLACNQGAWDDALHYVEASENLIQAGQPANIAFLRACRALVESHLGRVDSARQSAEVALELAEQTNAFFAQKFAAWALGHLALSLHEPADAHAQLGVIVAQTRAAGIREPGDMRFFADDIEALVALGQLDEAAATLAFYEECAIATNRLSALAAAARSRGMIAQANGDLQAALEAFRDSALRYQRVPIPFERARTLLALGSASLRARQKKAARESLEEAHAGFERIGARIWAARTQDELTRIGGRKPSDGSLTLRQRRVAELVAEGHTNQEVATALSITVRTVEGHLSRIYPKLGVRSRSGLARRFAEQSATTRVR